MNNKRESLLVARDMFPQATLEQIIEMAQKIEQSGYFDTPELEIEKTTEVYKDYDNIYPHIAVLTHISRVEDKLLVFSSRQMGMTTSLIRCALNLAQEKRYETPYKIVIVCNKQSAIKTYINNMSNILGYKSGIFINFNESNSSIVTTTFNDFLDTDDEYEAVFVDDAAYIPWIYSDRMLKKILTISKVMIGTTGSPDKGLFFHMWNNCNDFRHHSLPYYMHLDRDKDFEANTKKSIGSEAFRYSYLCEFRPVVE